MGKSTSLGIIVTFVILMFLNSESLFASDKVKVLSESPLVERARLAAPVYVEFCILCHGKEGYGDGRLALKLNNYPKTNLMVDVKSISRRGVRRAIMLGGTMGDMSKHMPPLGEELTSDEVDGLTELVWLLRTNHEKAEQIIHDAYNAYPPNVELGKMVFESNCILCHGKTGVGDGRMSKILKNPPPFDLTKSTLSDHYLMEIIAKGGEGVGRDHHMPPWGDQLTDRDIKSVVLHLNVLRVK